MATIAPKAPRGPGTVGVTRPATGALPRTDYRFAALMDTADVNDASLTIGLRLLLDSRTVIDETWTCGVKDRHGNPVAPFFTYSCPETPPTNFRVETDLPRLVNIGLDLTAVDPAASQSIR